MNHFKIMRNLFPNQVNVLFPAIHEQVENLTRENILQRFSERDVYLWSNDPADHEEISHRLAWMNIKTQDQTYILETEQLLSEVLNEGYTHALVLGMGGSSLAPEVYSQFIQAFKRIPAKALQVSILDSTSPVQIEKKCQNIPIDKTLFIVSSKSGTTVEVNTTFAFFWQLVQTHDAEQAGRHFVSISDSGTALHEMAIQNRFRKAFCANPDVGGRYSALIEFGLIPAILAGYKPAKILRSADLRSQAGREVKLSLEDGGIKLGIILAAAYQSGRDKLTILSDTGCRSFGSWIEQLVAESSGKNGKGIVPIDQSHEFPVETYGEDRLFVYLRDDGNLDEYVHKINKAGHPVFICSFDDLYDLPPEFFRWEVAIAFTCALLKINAFDQPNVQQSKDLTKSIIESLKKGQQFPTPLPLIFEDDKLKAFCSDLACFEKIAKLSELQHFFEKSSSNDYIAINAFVARTEQNEKDLRALQHAITLRYHMPISLGFGPRFLHSTGQLHKGGKNNGLFLVISQEEQTDLPIPSQNISFGDLVLSQAFGDVQALAAQNRRVLHLHFKEGRFEPSALLSIFG